MTEASDTSSVSEIPTFSYPKRFAQLLLSPYCWSSGKFPTFWDDCWDLIKGEGNKQPSKEIQDFRDKLDLQANECELWAPENNWSEFIPPTELDLLKIGERGVEKWKMNSLVKLLKLIRDKRTHPLDAGWLLNWFSKEGDTTADKKLFSQYWISKFVLITPFLWSQFKPFFGTALSEYYPSYLLDLESDWREMYFRPEQFASELYEVCMQQLELGLVEERFTVSLEQLTFNLELRTLPEGLDLLNKVLHGNSYLKILISNSVITTQWKGDDVGTLTHRILGDVSKEKCVAYIFLKHQYKIDGNLINDLFHGIKESANKVIIFTCKITLDEIVSNFKKFDNFRSNPLSWGELSNLKQNSIVSDGNFKIAINFREFGVNEILPGQEQEFLYHLNGKELNTFLRNKRLPVLQKYQVPKVDKHYQGRALYDPAIVQSDIFMENLYKNDVFIIVHEKPVIISQRAIKLTSSELFQKINSNEINTGIYTVRDEIPVFKHNFKKLQICEDYLERNLHFFYFTDTDNSFKWIRTIGSFDLIDSYIQTNADKTKAISETDFACMLDDCFDSNEINFIINQSGMGKSQFLVKITNKLAIERGRIPLYIYMPDLLAVLGEVVDLTCDHIVAALQNLLCSTYLEIEFLGRLLKLQNAKISANSNRVIIVFDGVDEVKLEQKESVLNTIKILHEILPTLPIIAAVREHMSGEIRKLFGTLGYKLCPISNPTRFINSYWCETIKERVCTPSTSSSAEGKESTKRMLSSLNDSSTGDDIFSFGLKEMFKNRLSQSANFLYYPKRQLVTLCDDVKRKFFLTAPNSLSISEDEILETVNSQHPNTRIIIIYDDLNVSISPLLINIARDIDDKNKNTVILLNSKIQEFAVIISEKDKIYSGDIPDDVIIDTVRKFANIPSRLVKDIEVIIFDGTNLSNNFLYESYLLRCVIHALNKIANSPESKLKVWVGLKSGTIKRLLMADLNLLEFEVEPVSKLKEEAYLKGFWSENLQRNDDAFFSKVLDNMTTECFESGLSGNYSHLVRLPLHCRLIGEVFEENFFKINFSSQGKCKYSICDLYKIILRKKYEIYFRKKYKTPKDVSIDGIPFNSFVQKMNAFLQFLSITLLFSTDIANQFKYELLDSGKIEKCEEFYEAAIEQGILQNRNPLRLTHVSVAEYFVAKFIYNRLKKYFSHESTFKFKLEGLETGISSRKGLIWNQGLKTNFESIYSIKLVHLGMLSYLNIRLEDKVDKLLQMESQDDSKKLIRTFIPRLMNRDRLHNLSFQGRIAVPENIAFLRALYYEGLINMQDLLLHSKKHLIGVFTAALANLDFEVTDHLVQKLGLGAEYFCEIASYNKSKFGLLHWIVIGICCAEESKLFRDVIKIKEKILEFFASNKVTQTNLVEEKNLEGQTPLLFLINCMSLNMRSSYSLKLYEFFVNELGANVNAVDNQGNTVLHYISCASFTKENYKVKRKSFEEVYSNTIQYFMQKADFKNSMNELGFTPAVNFMLSLDQPRKKVSYSKKQLEVLTKCLKLFDYKKDFYERDVEGNTSINKLIQYLCGRYAGLWRTRKCNVNLLNNIFSSELEIDFSTVNEKGEGVMDFALESESFVMINVLRIKAPFLFTSACEEKVNILHEKLRLAKNKDADQVFESIRMLFIE